LFFPSQQIKQIALKQEVGTGYSDPGSQTPKRQRCWRQVICSHLVKFGQVPTMHEVELRSNRSRKNDLTEKEKKNYAGVIHHKHGLRKRRRCCRTAKYSRYQADSNPRPRRVWPDHGPLGFQGSYPKRPNKTTLTIYILPATWVGPLFVQSVRVPKSI
jgi:hypothetical protein